MSLMSKASGLNLLLALCSIALTLFVLEIGLRVTGIQTVKKQPRPLYQPSLVAEISYELKPNMNVYYARNRVTTNSLGFRNSELEPGKPIIAFIGDSITFGHGVANHESLPARTEARLRGYTGLNAGVPGYNMIQEAAVYREKIAPLDPAALVLTFYFNDLGHNNVAFIDDAGFLRPANWVQPEKTCAPIEHGIMALLPGKCWLDDHSALYKFSKKIINSRTASTDWQKQGELTNKHAPTLEDQMLLYASQLDSLMEVVPDGVPRVFVMWPDSQKRRDERSALRTIAEERGFAVLDVLEHFPAGLENLSWDYTHPTAGSIDQVAEILASVLEQELSAR